MKSKSEIEKFIKEDAAWGLDSKRKDADKIKSLFGKLKFKEDTQKIKDEMKKWWENRYTK